MAYKKNIKQNSQDSHQTSPAYVLTFTRYSNRDTINYTSETAENTRAPLVVVNDAVSVVIENSKSNPSPTFSCVLKQGDINYLTAVEPGDYVIVNLVNWKDKAMQIRERALNLEPINKIDDGFKGLFKILDVRMVLATSPDGNKQYYVQITGRGFDEFNNILYFNPALANEKNLDFLFLNNFKNFLDLIKNKEKNNVQELVKELIARTIGVGIKNAIPKETALNQIPAYQIPKQISYLLNRGNVVNISDINNYYLGIWNPNPKEKINGFVSFFEKDGKDNFFKTKKELPGSRALSFQDLQNVKVWSLLLDYSNPVLNEMYTCYRVGVDGKYVYPTLIVRQKPFNTMHYEKFVEKKGGANSSAIVEHTKFLDLPRWVISPDLIFNLNLGRSDSGRINFVQVFTRSQSVDPNFDQAAQIAMGNYIEDKDDIIRNGRKPYTPTCNYDFAGTDSEHRAVKWSRLVADWVFNGHLKMNGSINCVGIEEPICVGDNLELDNIVYHIESISHNMQINEEGYCSFRTNISLSMGISDLSNSEFPVYAEMDYTDSKTRREDDFKNEKMLPGFSDTQDLPERLLGEEVKETKERSFTNPNKLKNNKR